MAPSAVTHAVDRVRGAVARTATSLRFLGGQVAHLGDSPTSTTRRERYRLEPESATETETQWTDDTASESVACFRFDDGYVVTVTYADRDVTWQLTPGPISLGSALSTAELYLQHGITVQIDGEGRPFIAVNDDGPRQVFEEIADEPVRYVYFDTVRTLDEFPGFLDISDELADVFDRMSPSEPHPLRGE